MSQNERIRELENQIRQLCLSASSAQGCEFESDLRKLDSALTRLEELKKANERRTPRPIGLKPLVLVVDDEESIVRTICDILDLYGFRTIGATSGGEAIAKIADSCPDLLLSDVMMPGMNGFETGLQVKDLCPRCGLLFFTGYAEVSDLAVELKSKGHAFELLSKPLPPSLLVDKVSAALAAS